MEKKTKVKDFYEKHKNTIDTIGLCASVAMVGVGCYCIGRYSGIEKVLKLKLGTYNITSYGGKDLGKRELTIRELLRQYWCENRYIHSIEFKNRDA